MPSVPDQARAAQDAGHDLVVFDLDGTLADSFAFFVACQPELARRHRFRAITETEAATLRHLPPARLMRHVGLARWRLPFVVRDFRRLMRAEGAAIECFPGIRDVLRFLHARGVALALVSSNDRANCERILGAAWPLLRHVECSASMFGKARRLRRVARAAGVSPARAIYIGDQLTDAQAARAAGMAFGAVHWGYATPAALDQAAPERTFREVADLLLLAPTRAGEAAERAA